MEVFKLEDPITWASIIGLVTGFIGFIASTIFFYIRVDTYWSNKRKTLQDATKEELRQ